MDDQMPPQEPGHVPPPPPPLATPPVISAPLPNRPKTSPIWKILTFVLIVLLGLSVLGNFVLRLSRNIIPRSHAMTDRNRFLEEVTIEQTNGDNKIAVIEVSGIITSGEEDRSGMTMVEYIREQLKTAAHDSDVKAVILKVNSPGGEVLASDDINKAIQKYQDDTHNPVIASMGTLAASGGYYISVPCRWIVANELTITGSIGVIMHAYNYRTLMDKIGIRPQVFKSGRFKDMLSGEKEPDTDKLSPEEQKTRAEEERMVQDLINETYGKFKEIVGEGRGNAAKKNKGEGKELVKDWQSYADGRVFSGKQALDLGFVDELGDFDIAVKRAKTLAGVSNASLIEYRIPFDLGSVLFHLVGKTEAPALKVELGMDLPKLQAGRLYFMAPMTIAH